MDYGIKYGSDEYKNWFCSLKEGDKVIYEHRHYSTVNLRETTVTKVTKKGSVRVEINSSSLIKDGRYYSHEKFNTMSITIYPKTEELINIMLHEKLVNDVAIALSKIKKLSDISTDDLDALLCIFEKYHK